MADLKSAPHGVYTFMNSGTAYAFDISQRMSKLKRDSPSLIQWHARFTLDAVSKGRSDVFIIDPYGYEVLPYALKQFAKKTHRPART